MPGLYCRMFSVVSVASAGYKYFFTDPVFGFVQYRSAVITYMQDK